jgi:hypothetical protein
MSLIVLEEGISPSPPQTAEIRHFSAFLPSYQPTVGKRVELGRLLINRKPRGLVIGPEDGQSGWNNLSKKPRLGDG